MQTETAQMYYSAVSHKSQGFAVRKQDNGSVSMLNPTRSLHAARVSVTWSMQGHVSLGRQLVIQVALTDYTMSQTIHLRAVELNESTMRYSLFDELRLRSI